MKHIALTIAIVFTTVLGHALSVTCNVSSNAPSIANGTNNTTTITQTLTFAPNGEVARCQLFKDADYELDAHALFYPNNHGNALYLTDHGVLVASNAIGATPAKVIFTSDEGVTYTYECTFEN